VEEENMQPWPGKGPEGHRRRGMRRGKNKDKNKEKMMKRKKEEKGREDLFPLHCHNSSS
jgi:hypothetical protein